MSNGQNRSMKSLPPHRIFTTRQQWRDWLSKHHSDQSEIWLGFYKRGVKKPCVSNNEAVEEALCFGWINGKVHKLDKTVYIQRFSPRHARSVWALSNKRRVEQLTKAGLMSEAGLKVVQQAKANGSWDAVQVATEKLSMAADIRKALQANKLAWQHFQNFTATQRRDYLWWVESAKTEATRQRRIDQLLSRCEQNLKPGQ